MPSPTATEPRRTLTCRRGLEWLAVAVAGLVGLWPSLANSQYPHYELPSLYSDLGYSVPGWQTEIMALPINPQYGNQQEAGDSRESGSTPPEAEKDLGEQSETALDDRVAALEKSIAELKKASEVEDEKKDEKKEKGEKEKKENEESEPHWIDVGLQGWTHEISGRVHADHWMWAHQNDESLAAYGPLQNEFEMRRLRLQVEGEGYGVYAYRVELDFEPEPGFVNMRDVYAEIRFVPLVGTARFGNVKEPFSLEELISSNNISFIERALPNVFVPSRHVGVAAYNHSEDDAIGWSYGAFFEDISQTAKERIDDNQGIDLVGRVWMSPIYAAEGRGVIHAGCGYIYTDDRDDFVVFASRPETHEETVFVSTGALPADTYHRANLELATVYGPLSFQSELIAVRTNGIAGSEDCSFYGAYAYVSYFLTGEHRPYDRIAGMFRSPVPNTNFWIVRTGDGPSAGWGAWEVLGRWSYIDLDDDGVPGEVVNVGGPNIRGQLHDVTLGLNWYWNRNMRWMFNYIHAWGDLTEDGVTSTDVIGTGFHFFF